MTLPSFPATLESTPQQGRVHPGRGPFACPKIVGPWVYACGFSRCRLFIQTYQSTGAEMSTALDVDIAALVGEMPAEPCESTTHDPADEAHDDGPATHYVRMICPTCSTAVVRAYCQGFVNFILYGGLIEHGDCPATPGVEWATILGPVGRLP